MVFIISFRQVLKMSKHFYCLDYCLNVFDYLNLSKPAEELTHTVQSIWGEKTLGMWIAFAVLSFHYSILSTLITTIIDPSLSYPVLGGITNTWVCHLVVERYLLDMCKRLELLPMLQEERQRLWDFCLRDQLFNWFVLIILFFQH